MTPRPSTAAPILAVLAIVLALLGAYVGGYLWMLEEGGFLTGEPDPGVLLDLRPNYRYGGSYATSAFAPVHWVDRQLRRDRWRIILPEPV